MASAGQTGGRHAWRSFVATYQSAIREPSADGASAGRGLLLPSIMPTTDPRAFLHVPSPTPSAPRGNDRSGPVARLAGGLAHGFNNLLTVLRGNAELLRGSLVDSRQKALLDAMLVACGRAHALTQQLLTYSGQQVIRPQWLEINTWLAEWLERHRVQLPGDVEARFVPCSLSTSVHIDPAQLAEVVSRLIVFACDAILAKPDGGGRIDLRTDCVHNPVGLPSGEYVRLAVAHDGRGMDETALAGIFEPYGSSDDLGDGTDFGLATIVGILRQNHGAVACASAPEAGATFTVLLPLRSAASVIVPRSPSAGRGELVMLVDDDGAVRQFAAAALRERGYDVVEFKDASAALHELVAGGKTPAILLTDVVMPGLDGKSLATLARQRWQALPVLYISGYSEDVVMRDGVLEGDIPLLEKPFSPDELALAVRAVIDAAAER